MFLNVELQRILLSKLQHVVTRLGCLTTTIDNEIVGINEEFSIGLGLKDQIAKIQQIDNMILSE